MFKYFLLPAIACVCSVLAQIYHRNVSFSLLPARTALMLHSQTVQLQRVIDSSRVSSRSAFARLSCARGTCEDLVIMPNYISLTRLGKKLRSVQERERERVDHYSYIHYVYLTIINLDVSLPTLAFSLLLSGH